MEMMLHKKEEKKQKNIITYFYVINRLYVVNFIFSFYRRKLLILNSPGPFPFHFHILFHKKIPLVLAVFLSF